MKKKTTERQNPNDAPARIIGLLEQNTSSGQNPSRVFEDWLTTVEHSLNLLPDHVRAVRRTGELAEDPPETKAAWAQLRERYRDRVYFDRFAEAFGVLLNSTVDADGNTHWMDALGNVYMEFVSHGYNGQYFTPWPIAKMMAEMTVGDAGAEEVRRRLTEAIAKSPVAVLGTMTADGIKDDGEAGTWFYQFVLPMAIEHYQPVTVMDPAVGSGIMLLAAASIYPRWMIHHGLVRFYGCDIDQTCVSMARINCMLYGLNGHAMRWALALSEPELQALPEPHASVYREAIATHVANPDAAKTTIKTARTQLALPGVV